MQTSKMMSPQSIQGVMQHSCLKALVDNARFLSELDKWLSVFIDRELKFPVRVCNIREDCLVLVTSTSAFATRVRYSEKLLIKELKLFPNMPQVNRIDCLVRPDALYITS